MENGRGWGHRGRCPRNTNVFIWRGLEGSRKPAYGAIGCPRGRVPAPPSAGSPARSGLGVDELHRQPPLVSGGTSDPGFKVCTDRVTMEERQGCGPAGALES